MRTLKLTNDLDSFNAREAQEHINNNRLSRGSLVDRALHLSNSVDDLKQCDLAHSNI